MSYLLDTHILIWNLLEPSKIPAHYRRLLTKSQEQKYISLVSLWEISLKFSLNKLDLYGNTPNALLVECLELGFEVLTPSPGLVTSFHQLPAVRNHKDPFDRMLIWQAIQGGFTLLSHDRQLGDYKIHGLKLA